MLASLLLAILFVHPIARQRLSPERRLRLLRGALLVLVGQLGAGFVTTYLGGREAVASFMIGALAGFVAGFLYLEHRFASQVKRLLELTPAKRKVMESALRGDLDPEDPTSAEELTKILDKM